jgi:putative membrane protein
MIDERAGGDAEASDASSEPEASGRSRRGGESRDSAGSRQGKEELARERTDWAQERTLLAKQRTFAAWLRTGLSAVAVGFAAAEFLRDLEPRWLVKTASILLVVAGAVIFVIGFVGYRGTFRKLQKEGAEGIPPWIIGAVTLAMLLGAALLLLSVLGE